MQLPWDGALRAGKKKAAFLIRKAAFLCILPLENPPVLLYTILCIIKTEQKQSEKDPGKHEGESRK